MSDKAPKGQAFLDKFAMVSAKIGNQIHLRTLRDAFATVMPIYILGGIAVLVNNVVFPWIFGAGTDALAAVQVWGNAITQGTMSFATVILAGVIAYCLAKNKEFENPLSCVVVGIATLVITMPQTIVASLGSVITATNAKDSLAQSVTLTTQDIASKVNLPSADYALTKAQVSGAFSSVNTGTNGLFGAIIVGLVAATLFIAFSKNKKLKIKLGDGVPPAVADSFNVMIPMLLTMSIFALGAALLAGLFQTDLMTLISTCIAAPLKGFVNAGPIPIIVIYTLANLLFCLGIHQSTLTGSLTEPILTMLIMENTAFVAAGQAIPADHYMNMSLINTFALIGGSGCTLMLLLDTFFFSKNKASKDVAKLALLPSIFNINEPVIYGYPIVYNLPLIVPFVILPDVLIAITYGLTCAGLISPCQIMAPWTCPIFASGLISTGGDFRAVIWQVIEVAIGMAVYLPFMKISERVAAKQAAELSE